MSMGWVQVGLILVVLALALVSLVAYLNPIKHFAVNILNSEHVDRASYLNPTLSLVESIYRYQYINTSAVLSNLTGIKNVYLSPTLNLAWNVYRYEAVNESATLSRLSMVNSSLYTMLIKVLTELNTDTSSIVSSVEGSERAVLSGVRYYSNLTVVNVTSGLKEESTRILSSIESNSSLILNSMGYYYNELMGNLTSSYISINGKLNEALGGLSGINSSIASLGNEEVGILSSINNTVSEIGDNVTSIKGKVNLILTELTAMYQVYGTPGVQLGARQYALFTFSNLTLVSSLLISLTLTNQSAYIYCYTVPGTGIYVTAASMANYTGTVTLRVVNYPCWQVTVYAPGAMLNWFSGVLLYQG